MGRIGRRLDTEVENESSQEGRSDSNTGIGNSFVNVTGQKKADGGIALRKERDLDPLMIKPPRTVEGIELAIRGASKTVVDWINGKAKEKASYRAIETIQIQLMEWWKKGVDLSQRIGVWAVHIFREHNKEADLWAVMGPKGSVRNGRTSLRPIGQKLRGYAVSGMGVVMTKVCGAGFTISIFMQGLGMGLCGTKNCGPVEGSNSLDAELVGCADRKSQNLDAEMRKGRLNSNSNSIIIFEKCIFLFLIS